ncbi:MAG: YeeE/YedE thiosulfate transporter family protein [Bacteroidota bacterium]
MKFWKEDNTHIYWNPYFGGLMLGLLLILTFYITGRGVGATGGTKSAVVATVETVAHDYAERSKYYSKYFEEGRNPMKNWLMFETIGILAGAFLSGALSGRVKFRVQHAPHITSKKRLMWAAIGGLLFGIGSQFARGCTSGAALSGAAVLSLGGFITMAGIFGTAYLVAYLFRKLWIQ